MCDAASLVGVRALTHYHFAAMQDDPAPIAAVTRGDVARGAGLAGLSRAGALIEALAQPLYTWLFGIATYGSMSCSGAR